MLVLALDVGTSSTRAQCFDDRGQAVPEAHARVAYEAVVTADGGVELEPEALLEAVGQAVDGCLARLGPRCGEIRAVGASIFWHSLLALAADGRPLTRVITWADTRSTAEAEDLRRRLDEGAVHARTGAPLHSTFYPARLRWLRRTQPDLFARAARWCGFAEYLALRFTGALRASVSMASGTGLLDQSVGTWDRELLESAGITADCLPPISDEPAPGLAPAFAARWPALAQVPWHPGRGDGACSNLGSDCTTPARLALNVGTSSALRMVTREGFGARAMPPGLWRYRVDTARSLVGGATNEGGNVLSWCRRVLAVPAKEGALERALDNVPPDGHGLTVLPFLAGERSPGWRAEARAALTGASLGTDAVAVLRAFMEAVAYRLGMIYEQLAPLAAAGHQIIASGGALHHSRVWASIMADVLGVPLILSAEPEASSRGAALLALEALGASPSPLGPGVSVTPDPGRHAIYRAARERQRRLYDNIVGPRLS
ncbi:MAG TPA: gluconokinase [Methylomirabilota bacterium]|nr:gluconokinase [Methylomirabilota bacterium]